MIDKTPHQMLRELTTGNVADPKSFTKPGKVFGGTGPSKKQLKQLNKMRIYLKADLLGLNLPKISSSDLKILNRLRQKI